MVVRFALPLAFLLCAWPASAQVPTQTPGPPEPPDGVAALLGLIGSVIGITGMLCARMFAEWHWPLAVAILVTLVLCGLAIGLEFLGGGANETLVFILAGGGQ